VLDLLLEEALRQAGLKRRMSIDAKARKAGTRTGRPPSISVMAWAALMDVYVETVQLRHSLVHRHVHTTAAGSLVGVDENGNQLAPFSSSEQEALARAVLMAADMAPAASVDPRAEARLLSHLAHLNRVHGNSLTASEFPAVIPLIRVIVDLDASTPDRYRLDIPAIRERQLFKESKWIDLVVAPRDRQGQELWGRLEEAPDAVVALNPDVPPGWLS
jgi:hypothetical protein